jgi:Yip1-like protein
MDLAPPSPAPTCALHPSVRAEQACPRCGTFACRACLRTGLDGQPLCVTCETREAAAELPWDVRARLGTISAFIRTCWSILWHPIRTLDRTQPEGGFGSSLWFVVLAQVATYFTTGLAYSFVGMAFLGVYLFGAEKGEKTLTPLTSAGIAVGFIAVMVLMVIAVGLGAVLLLSALDHLVLKLIGARPRPYPVTLRAHALSMAPCVCGLIPFCGPYVVPIWAVVIRIFAYRGLHRISTGKAVAGALAVPGTLIVLMTAGYAGILFMSLANGRGTP